MDARRHSLQAAVAAYERLYDAALEPRSRFSTAVHAMPDSSRGSAQ
jgi:hypothetical protein